MPERDTQDDIHFMAQCVALCMMTLFFFILYFYFDLFFPGE